MFASVVSVLLLSLSVSCQEVSTSANVNITSGGASATASGSASSSVPAESCPCNDEAPKAAKGGVQYTCAEQKAFGQCDADFMLGFCECTCGRCCPCNDFPPTIGEGSAFTCIQQKEFGKCDDAFMQGFCECECGRCPALAGAVAEPVPTPSPKGTTADAKAEAEVTTTPEPVVAPEPVVVAPACPNGLIPIFGSSECETSRCAQNRQRCANGCGGLAAIKFDCKDVSEGGSSAFSSSCACAGK
eukprot:TRINITY_DN2974_c0_g1_i3.p1 TRINITY_DN2974_c0_g1~~TRINITY_DN2974_c0_g1_i3.p1  ORF type:complete len:282 (-),score=67.14 TRINITY_DN2974_c0_g1_i3:276-1007(-)